MYISLSTHLFVYHDFNSSFIEITRGCGIRNIEVFAVNPHFPYRDEEFIDSILESCDYHGVSIRSVHFPLYLHIEDIRRDKWLSLSTEDRETREKTIAETAAAARLLEHSGGGVLVVHGSLPSEERGGKRTFLLIESIHRLLDSVPQGVVVAIENSTTGSGTAQAIMEIAESFPSDKVGICIDVGHANVAESAPSALASASPRLRNVHCSDNYGVEDEHLPPGEGTLNWRKVIRTLGGVSYDGPLTLEIRDPLKGTIDDTARFTDPVAKSVKFLEELLEAESG